MRNKFAPLAMLFGLLTALLLGGTATAQADTGVFKCSQDKSINVVTCNTILKDVTVIIKGNKIVTDVQLVEVENVLNKTEINVSKIQGAVVTVYKSFNHFITVGDVTVKCVAICK